MPFKFGSAAVKAFNALKYCLSHAPELALPDPDLPFEVVVDAYDCGCGAVFQDQRPVAFHCDKLSSTESPSVALCHASLKDRCVADSM